MDRSVQKNGLVNLVIAFILFIATVVLARFSHSLAGAAAAFFMGLTFLVTFISWFQMRLEESERVERLEVEELARSRGESGLFETKDAELFPARRGREQFAKFFVPAFTILMILLEGFGAYWMWKSIHKATTGVPADHIMSAMALFGIFSLLLFLVGRFSATVARLNNHPLLRPGASFLLLSAYVCFATALGIAGLKAEWVNADFYVARVLTVLLGLMAVETFVALLLEIYRPRVKGKAVRPLYDSRMVGLLGQPESLFTTAAQTLDYQFGFKISETWLFQTVKQYLPMLIVAQVLVLLLSTCVVFIDVGEQGVLERFGQQVQGRTVLNPGPHLKLPWPIDQVHRFQTEQIQGFNIGFTNDPSLGSVKTIVWTIPHDKPENFLVANRHETTNATTTTTDGSGPKTPPGSLLAVGIPVQFRITDVLAWVYKNEDSQALLQDIALRAVTRYLAGADIEELLAQGRLTAADTLRERIQAEADARELGVTITFVGLQDIHPPTTVAPDYELLVATTQSKQAVILRSQAAAFTASALADARAFTVKREAESYRQRLEVNSLAQAMLFTNQIPAFEASPRFYVERTYFQAFTRGTARARKYIVLTTNTEDVIQLDLQDKLGADFLNMNVNAPKSQ